MLVVVAEHLRLLMRQCLAELAVVGIVEVRHQEEMVLTALQTLVAVVVVVLFLAPLFCIPEAQAALVSSSSSAINKVNDELSWSNNY
jgi:hypothetical protein